MVCVWLKAKTAKPKAILLPLRRFSPGDVPSVVWLSESEENIRALLTPSLLLLLLLLLLSASHPPVSYITSAPASLLPDYRWIGFTQSGWAICANTSK